MVLAACGAGSTPAAPGNTQTTITVKIGTDFPTSGADQSGGLPTEQGAHLAVDQANAKNLVPGVHFEFVPKDDVGASGAHDANRGQQNVTDLIGDAQVAGIVGPLNSSVAIAELPVTNNAPIALLSPANTNDCLTQETPADQCGGAKSKLATYRPTGKVNYFRIATLDQFQSSALAQYAYNKLNFKKAYVIDDSQTYGVGIADGFVAAWTKLGGTVIDRKRVAPTTTSFVNLLTQVAQAKPDFIFFGGNDSTGGIPLRQQMQQVPALANTVLVGGDGILTSAFAKTIGKSGGKVYSSVAAVNAQALTDNVSTQFFKDYSAKYGANNIGSYSAGGFDSASILIQAIGRALKGGAKAPANSNDQAAAKTFRQAVIDEIAKTDYNGVTGHHTFNANGDTTNRVISVYTIADDPTVGDGWKYLDQLNVGS